MASWWVDGIETKANETSKPLTAKVLLPKQFPAVLRSLANHCKYWFCYIKLKIGEWKAWQKLLLVYTSNSLKLQRETSIELEESEQFFNLLAFYGVVPKDNLIGSKIDIPSGLWRSTEAPARRINEQRSVVTSMSVNVNRAFSWAHSELLSEEKMKKSIIVSCSNYFSSDALNNWITSQKEMAQIECTRIINRISLLCSRIIEAWTRIVKSLCRYRNFKCTMPVYPSTGLITPVIVSYMLIPVRKHSCGYRMPEGVNFAPHCDNVIKVSALKEAIK